MKLIVATVLLFAVCSVTGALRVRVIGGDDVNSQDFPYLVSIQTGIFAQHSCSGAIISPSWVVTAAHCAGLSLIVSRVVAGTYNLSDVENNQDAQIRFIDLYNVIIHPEYSNLDNDIALLKMTVPFEFNDNVQALPISKVPCVAADEINTFSGWGTQNGVDSLTAVLQTSNLTIMPFKDCQISIFEVYGDNLSIKSDIHVCLTGSASPCLLDGGSPLVQDNRLIGLLSWLPATCADGKVPAIFTNTGFYKEFIKEYVDDLP